MCCSQAEIDRRKQSTGAFLAAMDSMSADNMLELLEEKGVRAAKDVRGKIQELEAKASVAVSLGRALEQAKKRNKTNEGNRTWQTLLTAAAFPAGDDEETSTI